MDLEQLRLDLAVGEARGKRAIVARDDGTILDPRTNADWREWVAAGETRQWCSRNELVDWLEEHGSSKGFVPDDLREGYDPRFDFSRWVADQGKRFEAKVLEHLETLVPVTRIAGGRTDARSREAAEATWDAMAAGAQAIAGGVLRDPQARMYGRVDLIVRSDTLALLCGDAFGEGDDPHEPAPALGGAPWHYRIVEIHYSTIGLLKSGEISLSDDLPKAAQAWAYSSALGRMQGLVPAYSYVLGRGWKQGKEHGDRCWERMGRIGRETLVKRHAMVLGDVVAAGAAWIRRVRREGAAWEVLPRPTVPELWPNMRADSDYRWHGAKTELARRLGEITLLRTVNAGHRERAHAAGIERWDDPRMSAAVLGLADRDAAVLDAILAVHRGDEPVLPKRIGADGGKWRERAPLELYVDFETVNDLADDLSKFPEKGGTALVFQVGCGRFAAGEWTFRQFTARDLTVAAEGEMLDEWIEHVIALAREAGLPSPTDARIFHWSAAEPVNMESEYHSARTRHADRAWPELGWYDVLQNVVRAEPVVIKGSMSFGLKSVARALHAHGLIQTLWGEGLADGTGAMAAAWLAADEARRAGIALDDVELMREVDRYNEIDCRVMAEVLDYLRRHH